MRSPAGWEEPGQRPAFDEFTLVLAGVLRVTHEGGSLDVAAGQAVVARAGEWVQYSTPDPAGAEYVAECDSWRPVVRAGGGVREGEGRDQAEG